MEGEDPRLFRATQNMKWFSGSYMSWSTIVQLVSTLCLCVDDLVCRIYNDCIFNIEMGLSMWVVGNYMLTGNHFWWYCKIKNGNKLDEQHFFVVAKYNLLVLKVYSVHSWNIWCSLVTFHITCTFVFKHLWDCVWLKALYEILLLLLLYS